MKIFWKLIVSAEFWAIHTIYRPENYAKLRYFKHFLVSVQLYFNDLCNPSETIAELQNT